MPLLKFISVDEKEICTISKILVNELEQLLRCSRSSFTLEVLNSTFIRDGEISQRNPLVEIAWFDRGQKIQDKIAYIITRHIQSLGYSTVDIIFYPLNGERFYKNGEHY